MALDEGQKKCREGTFIGRYLSQYAGAKQSPSDGNMPLLSEQKTTLSRRGPMSVDFRQAAVRRESAIDAVRHNGVHAEAGSASDWPPARLNGRALNRDVQVAEPA